MNTESTSDDTSLLQRNEDQNKNLDTVYEEKTPKKTLKTDKKAICHLLTWDMQTWHLRMELLV